MGSFVIWRRGRDSNPRWSYQPHTPLAGERLQPLGHLSFQQKSNYNNCLQTSKYLGQNPARFDWVNNCIFC